MAIIKQLTLLVSVLLVGRLAQGCDSGKWQCHDGSCIWSSWKCDGYKDCADGSDEIMGSVCTSCPKDKFDCGDGKCIWNSWKCDGYADCDTGADENSTTCHFTTHAPTPPPPDTGCPKHQFNCGNGQCISDSWKCDGYADCNNGADENTTTCPPPTPMGTPDPNFVVGEGCGSRKFEQNVMPHVHDAQSFVVGGENAVRGSLPWQVSVRTWYHFCGGTVIDKKWILSAAHCFSDGSSGVKIVAGDHRFGLTEGSEQTIAVEESFVHPEYDAHTTANDIALVKLVNELTFDDYTQPACLPDPAKEDEDYAAGNWVLISGWGGTAPKRRGPSTLQVATVPFVSQDVCKSPEIYGDMIGSSMVCAGKIEEGGTDTCQGDSGGPLVRKVNDKYTVLGVVSWGVGCARKNKPGVYTRTAQFTEWINKVIYSNQ